ncbi:hypothetical protein XCR_3410 [Xanthomonas campestris pv. raphani 756C]|nr:hypothetical protein XCR_3410 [Xanthomonas campestris pv. raphani 756C]
MKPCCRQSCAISCCREHAGGSSGVGRGPVAHGHAVPCGCAMPGMAAAMAREPTRPRSAMSASLFATTTGVK